MRVYSSTSIRTVLVGGLFTKSPREGGREGPGGGWVDCKGCGCPVDLLYKNVIAYSL